MTCSGCSRQSCWKVGGPIDGSSVNDGPPNMLDSLDDKDFTECFPNDGGDDNDAIIGTTMICCTIFLMIKLFFNFLLELPMDYFSYLGCVYFSNRFPLAGVSFLVPLRLFLP